MEAIFRRIENYLNFITYLFLILRDIWIFVAIVVVALAVAGLS
jgi:hypothetical protein